MEIKNGIQNNHEISITIRALKKEKKFQDWELIRISRLSIMPVTKPIWNTILQLSQN